MARSIPKIRDDSLQVPTLEGHGTSVIMLGTAAWDTWVEHARSFRFESPHASFTARKEQRPGGWYWYAYRRRHGTLHIAYLGKSEELTLERLHTVAAVLERAEDSSEETSHQPQQRSLDTSLQTHHSSSIPSPPALSVEDSQTSARPAPQHNLPMQVTSLVGREPASATATALLRRPEVRLLSMIGTGGIGKTRLAIEIATQLLEDFPDGISFVALAPLRDPDMVLPTIAHTLGLQESASEPVADRLHTYLRDKHLLLVLDNFEHLMPAAPVVGELLTTCPNLKLLVTSREVLHLRAEQQFSVPPLAVPDRKHVTQVQSLTQYPALELFLQRARAVKHDFQLHENNAQSLAEICMRLDGLPLAIELAAARISMLSPQALLARLDHRLQVLTHGASDLPERQQTLRQTIQWSYELLKPEEQRLFQRMSVFAGGTTLEAVEAVCEALGDQMEWVFDAVASLIGKSLLQQTELEGEQPRLVMLETIREYGLERLRASGELEATRRAHAAYYLQLAEKAEPHFFGQEEALWLDRLELELNNLRAALLWAIEKGEAGESMETALRLAGALLWFWMDRGYAGEALTALKRALASSQGVAPVVRAKALVTAGELADAPEQGNAFLRESLAIFQELGDTHGMALSLFWLGMLAELGGSIAEAHQLIKEALALFKQVGDQVYIAWAYARFANQLKLQGEYSRAHALHEENLRRFREQGNTWGTASTLSEMGWSLFLTGDDPARARSLLQEGLTLAREKGIFLPIVQTLSCLAELALAQEDAAGARSLIEEAWVIVPDWGYQDNRARLLFLSGQVAAMEGNYTAAYACYKESLAGIEKSYIPSCLEGAADIAMRQAEFIWAARLWGAAEALRQAMGTPLPPVYRAHYEQALASARKHLAEQAFVAAWKEGRTMTAEQALAAQGLTFGTPTPPAKSPTIYPSDLTAREMEVLRLVAQGLSDEQVAEQLVISRHTVNSHLKAIYGKIRVSSRSAATHYAMQHHLL